MTTPQPSGRCVPRYRPRICLSELLPIETTFELQLHSHKNGIRLMRSWTHAPKKWMLESRSGRTLLTERHFLVQGCTITKRWVLHKFLINLPLCNCSTVYLVSLMAIWLSYFQQMRGFSGAACICSCSSEGHTTSHWIQAARTQRPASDCEERVL